MKKIKDKETQRYVIANYIQGYLRRNTDLETAIKKTTQQINYNHSFDKNITENEVRELWKEHNP